MVVLGVCVMADPVTVVDSMPLRPSHPPPAPFNTYLTPLSLTHTQTVLDVVDTRSNSLSLSPSLYNSLIIYM